MEYKRLLLLSKYVSISDYIANAWSKKTDIYLKVWNTAIKIRDN